jgi:hypothetical protein
MLVLHGTDGLTNRLQQHSAFQPFGEKVVSMVAPRPTPY